MRLLGIPDALRKFGLEPIEVAGWKTRGLEFVEKPTITLRHWTAGPTTGKAPSLSVCTNGRPDLPGPLCQVLQERTGGENLDRVYVVASGRANHAGEGRWESITSGNRYGTGNEIEWSGPNEAFSVKRRETSERVAAALLSLSKTLDGKYACEHREYALPPGRKIDTNLNAPAFRLAVNKLLHPPVPTPPTPPVTPTPPEEDFMPKPLLLRLNAKDIAVLYMSSARTVHWIQGAEALQGYKLDMQMNGLSPDVCVLSAIEDDNGSLDELHDFVVNLPFIGDWPTFNGQSTGVMEAWKGAHIPGE